MICVVLYTNNAHAYWLDFSTQTLHTFPAVLELTLAFCGCKVGESTLHKILLWVLT